MATEKLFSSMQLADIAQLLKSKTEIVGDHHIFKVMKSRKFRQTVDVSYKRKFYPVWFMLNALGKIKEGMPEDDDQIMIPYCGKEHCVNPDHLTWISRKEYAKKYVKKTFDHPLSKWNDAKITEFKRMYAAGASRTEMVEKLELSFQIIQKACNQMKEESLQ